MEWFSPKRNKNNIWSWVSTLIQLFFYWKNDVFCLLLTISRQWYRNTTSIRCSWRGRLSSFTTSRIRRHICPGNGLVIKICYLVNIYQLQSTSVIVSKCDLNTLEKTKGKSRLDNPEKLATMDTQEARRRKTKQKAQHKYILETIIHK